MSKNKQKNNDAENNEVTKQEQSDREEILRAKEERFFGKDREDDEPEEEKPDTPFRRFLKKVDFFWEYYKWFVIIPTLVIVIVVLTTISYIEESRPRRLELVIQNDVEREEMIYTIEHNFIKDTNADYALRDIRMEYGLQYPDVDHYDGLITDVITASMQKFNVMVVTKRVDVAITNTWVLDDYALENSALDLREYLDEEFIEEHKDDIVYVKNDYGEVYPAGIYLRSKVFVDAYMEDMPPVAASFKTAPHKEEAANFIKWAASLP